MCSGFALVARDPLYWENSDLAVTLSHENTSFQMFSDSTLVASSRLPVEALCTENLFALVKFLACKAHVSALE